MKRYILVGKLVLAGTLATALVACGGSSDSDSGAGTQGTEPPEDESTDEGGSQTPSPPTTDVPYQTGYVLSSTRGERVATGFVSSSIDFETDEQANEISDGITANVYPDFAYDDRGRATTIDYEFGTPVTLTYNDDDTLARIEKGRADGGVAFSEYEYDDGNLIARRSGTTEGGETTITGRIEYEYSADNILVSAEDFSGDNPNPFSTYQYVTDADGRITELTENDSVGNQRFRLVFTYDEFSNVTQVERFDSDGGLQIISTYTYTPSSEPVVNVISLFSALTGTYVPSPDPVEYF